MENRFNVGKVVVMIWNMGKVIDDLPQIINNGTREGFKRGGGGDKHKVNSDYNT